MKSGIYRIINKVNDKMYIGSSYNLEKRLASHISMLINNKHHSIHLQNAYNKYGDDNFDFEVLEECEREFLLDREQYYLNLYLEADKYVTGESMTFIEKGYNICSMSIKGFTGKHSRESLIKQIKTRGFCEIYKVNINGEILDIYDLKSECPDLSGNIYKSIKTKVCLKGKNYCYINATDYFEGFKPTIFVPWNKGLNIEYKGEKRVIYLYDIYGTFIQKFDSLLSCSKYCKAESANLIKKINNYPKKILIDSESSKYLLFDEFETEKILEIRNYWTQIFDIIKQSNKKEIEIIDCFNNYIGKCAIKEIFEILEVTYSTINTNIYKNRRVKSLSIKRL